MMHRTESLAAAPRDPSPLELRVPAGGGVRVAIFLDCDPECGMPLIGALRGRPVYGRAEYESEAPAAVPSPGAPPGLRVFRAS